MNILMIGLDINPPWIEGIRNTVYSISRELIKRNVNVSIFTKGGKNQLPYEKLNNINFYRVLTASSSSYLSGAEKFLIKAIFELKNILLKKKYDIIHIHTTYSIFATYFAFLANLFRKNYYQKVFFTLYSSQNRTIFVDFNIFKNTILIFAKNMYALKIPIINKVITISKKGMNKLIKMNISKNKLIFFPHLLIDFNKFKPINNEILEMVRENLGLKDEFIILFGGDLSPQKGIEFILAVIYILRKIKKSFKLKLLIMDKGLYEKNLDRRKMILDFARRYGIRDTIKFIGIRSDIEKIINISDIAVFPYTSLYSFMDIPLAILESMACKKVIVVSQVGAIDEVIKNKINGFIFKPDDIHSLFMILNSIIEECYDVNSISENAYNYVRKFFSQDKIVDRLYNIYLNII